MNTWHILSKVLSGRKIEFSGHPQGFSKSFQGVSSIMTEAAYLGDLKKQLSPVLTNPLSPPVPGHQHCLRGTPAAGAPV